jgi:Mg2+ and Co2+ transporter CorA
MLVSEQENSLIEQLRSFGVSIEDLEALTGEDHTQVEHVVESPPPAEVAVETLAAPPAQTGSPVAFQPLIPETAAATVREDTSLKEDTAGLRQQAALFDANQTRDRILAEAKDAAAEIRANAVRLVSVKLQSAEDEIMTMRTKATEEVAQLRKETSKALAARLQEAGSEALALREAARQETQVFWESASREFSDARARISQMHAHMVQLLESVNDAVASVEEAASSIAALCESHLEAPSRREGPE